MDILCQAQSVDIGNVYNQYDIKSGKKCEIHHYIMTRNRDELTSAHHRQACRNAVRNAYFMNCNFFCFETNFQPLFLSKVRDSGIFNVMVVFIYQYMLPAKYSEENRLEKFDGIS